MANEFIARNGLIAQNNSTVTGSLTVTQGITGSLFGTASNVQGGATNYIPLWNTATSLSSSVLYQSTGKVGIGNTSPSSNLTVGNGTATGNQFLRVNSVAADISIGQSSGIILGGSPNQMGLVISDNASYPMGVGTTTAQPLILGTNNDEKIRITSAGNVGIGETAPYSKLHVWSAKYNDSLISSNPSAMVIGGTISQLSFNVDGGSTAPYNISMQARDNTFSAGNIIMNSLGGNVGIGTASPTSGKLQVNGNVFATSFTGSLFGTASYVSGSVYTSANPALSSSYALTSSYALNGGVTSIVAGTNITISPTNGLGAVTINSSGGGGSAFPYTGSAIITGSLVVTGSITVTKGVKGIEGIVQAFSLGLQNIF